MFSLTVVFGFFSLLLLISAAQIASEKARSSRNVVAAQAHVSRNALSYIVAIGFVGFPVGLAILRVFG